jgi:hypothetical protein
MAIPRLRSFRRNKRILLTAAGYKSIRTFRRENPEYGSNDEAYEALLDNYNTQVDNLNRLERNRKRREKRREQTLQKVRENVFRLEDVNGGIAGLSQLRTQLNNRRGRRVIVEYIDGENVLRHKQYDIPVNNFSNWWKKENIAIYYQVDSETYIWDENPDGSLFFYEPRRLITSEKVIQAFREGITNCLLTPILNWAEVKFEEAKARTTKFRYKKIINDVNEMMKEYVNGVPENCVNIVCDKLQIDIDISLPFGEKKLIEAKSTKKALNKFRYMNTRIDHIDFNKLVNDKEVTQVSKDTLYELIRKFEKEGIYYTYQKNMTGYCEISTLESKYRLINEYSKIKNEFEKDYGFDEIKIDDIHQEKLSCFVRDGVHYNGVIDFDEEEVEKNVEDIRSYVKHIDMTKAYANFKSCKYYDGFLGKITDFRKCNKVMGNGLYLIDNLVFTDNYFKKLNDKMVMYSNKNVYTNVELKMLDDNGVSYDILCGCWGVEKFDFDFPESMLQKEEGVSHYAKWTGASNSVNLTSSFYMKGNDEMAYMIQEHTEGTVRYFRDDEIQVEYEKPYAQHLSHITAFITAYTRMNIIEQLLEINYDNLIRVCVDGIYFKGDVVCKNVFTHKTKMTFKNGCGDEFCSNLYEREYDIANFREHFGSELHLGEGGCGKTHTNLTDEGLCKVLFVAPSWKLARAKQLELGVRCSVWARILMDDPEKINFVRKNTNVLIIDEVSMMSEESKKFIFKHYGDMKLIFCGDLGFQLPCINGSPMDGKGFDNTVKHLKDYRCKCPVLKELKEMLRLMIMYGRSRNEINNYVIEFFKEMNRVVPVDYLKSHYKIEDMILTGTNKLKDYFTGLFPDLKKYIVLGNNRLYSNGEILFNEPEQVSFEVRHAFTTHSIQGETAHHNLYIDSSRMFDERMFYTAVSRAKKIEQIFIIEKEIE